MFGCKPESLMPAQKSPNSTTTTTATATAAAEDARVGRNVMSIAEVVAELRAGVPREQVLQHVRTRRIASLAVEANDLELAANGAGRELIAALKDPKNLPTAAQEAAYMQLRGERQPTPARAQAGVR
jgi:hypothetical protein